jgi:hypothetical protein
MTGAPSAIATVRLARSLPRLLAVPAAGIVAGGVAAVAAVIYGGLLGAALAGAGVAAAAVYKRVSACRTSRREAPLLPRSHQP